MLVRSKRQYYGIPTVETRAVENEDEAVKCTSQIGNPVVLKVFSETITHKTNVGGVKLNLQDEQSVRSAFRGIKSSVTEKTGRDQFLGVSVQPMVRQSLRIESSGAAWIRCLGRCSCLVPAANSSRSMETMQWPFRRSTVPLPSIPGHRNFAPERILVTVRAMLP
jgi:hypothetical protein